MRNVGLGGLELEQREKARLFREMHYAPQPLCLPNAWDVITARIFASVGFPAIATTSAGIAATLGYPDGEKISCAEMLAVVRRIANSVNIPVTADIESGYGTTLRETVDNVEQFIESGIVGINIEDSIRGVSGRQEDPLLQAEKIAAIRELAVRLDIPLVINARVDTLQSGVTDIEERLHETFYRADVYRAAGADCIYVFGEHEHGLIGRLVRGISGPLNILVGRDTPSIRELADLGVARVSLGPGVMRASMGLVKRVADELIHEGTYEYLRNATMSYHEMFGYLGPARQV
ncbi:isocitrate lyase/phosphoenolpyruvate mutase family protein [Alicyclobacillus curvatus]|nr:isocitrate lyase/phosphoenolpyruvate mutase family protein [Alicyclobacillus curvatus]